MEKSTEFAQNDPFSTLIAHHELLMEHKDLILQDPYLRSCRVGVGFGFSFAGPIDIRLGNLLYIWEKVPRIKGKRALILKSGGGLSGASHTCWYNLEDQQMEEGSLNFVKEAGKSHNSLIVEAYRLFSSGHLYVDLDRLTLQLKEPEKCAYSEWLRFALAQFTTALENSEAGLDEEQSNNIKLYTESRFLKMDIRIPGLSIRVDSPGIINYKGVQYQEEIDELLQKLGRDTGFKLRYKPSAGSEAVFTRTFNPYERDELFEPATLQKIRLLFAEHKRGMEQLNEKYG